MDVIDQGWEFIQGINPQFFAGFVAMGIIVGTTYFWTKLDQRKAARKLRIIRSVVRGKWMTTPEQENVEKILMSDGITDVIEELVFMDKMSPERAIVWYRRFGNLLNLPDLLQKHEKSLKERIRKRTKGNVIPFPDATGLPSNGGRGLIMMKAIRPT